MIICQENPDLVEIGAKKLGALCEDQSMFYYCWQNKLAIKALSSSEMLPGY
jgi:hypothetical protein